jgi:Tfp pilus assembly protein PilN
MKAVNLLPPDSRGATKAPSERSVVVDDSSSFGAYAVLGALALAVLAFAGVVLTGNAVKDREAELQTAQAQSQQISARVAALKPYADFDQMASERVATVKDLAGRRFDWEQAIRDLSRAIPADVTLSELNGSVSTDAGSAGGSALRSAISAPAISINGCTDDQKGVARLMARLRNVDGVTRVSLAKSEKEDAGKGTGVGAGAEVPGDASASIADRRSAPCGTGRKPMFEMVMFFENDAEAASGPGASPAAAGAAPASTTPAPADGSSSTTSTTGQTGQSAPASTGTQAPAAQAQGGVSP